MYNYRKAANNDTRDLNISMEPMELDRLLDSAFEKGSGHTIIVGKTGTGKSNLLSLVLKHLDKRPGNIIVLDPHSQVSDKAILTNTRRELVFLTGHDYNGSESIYTGLNVLGTSGMPADSVIISEWLRDTISSEEIMSHGTWGPRLEVILGPLLMECIRSMPGITLRQFQTLLLDRRELSRMLDDSSNSDLRAFIGTQMKDTRAWMDMISSTINKLMPMLENEEIMRLISTRDNPNLDLGSVIHAKNSLIVIDNAVSGIGTTGYRLASVLILSKIWNTLIRSGPTENKTYIVIDEAHFFSEKLIETLLSEGRKYGIVLILSYQFMAQLSKRGLASLFGNVKNIFVFSCSYDDALLISRNITDDKRSRVLADVLMSQNGHSATFFSTSSGHTLGPKTLMPPKMDLSRAYEDLQSLKKKSILKFGSQVSSSYPISKRILSDHEKIVVTLNDALKEKGFICSKGEAKGSVVPDLLAEIGVKRIYFEVEVSDLDNTFRIAKKLMDYGNEQVVFVTMAAKVNILIQLLGRIYNMTTQGGFYERSGKRVLKSDVLSSIFHVYIMCVGEGIVYMHNGSDLVKFTRNQLYLDPFFVRRVKNLSFAELRISILRGMVEGRINNLPSFLKEGGKGYNSSEVSKFLGSLQKDGYRDPDICAILGI
jgi:energy-coupling factor transporter ATP-binding protein EcfA2